SIIPGRGAEVVMAEYRLVELHLRVTRGCNKCRSGTVPSERALEFLLENALARIESEPGRSGQDHKWMFGSWIGKDRREARDRPDIAARRQSPGSSEQASRSFFANRRGRERTCRTIHFGKNAQRSAQCPACTSCHRKQ